MVLTLDCTGTRVNNTTIPLSIMAHHYAPKPLYETKRWRYVIRKQVLMNADYRCARCSADLHGTLYHAHVHHIIPTTHAPQLAYDLFNLEALCTHCHNKEHGRGKYGCSIDGSPIDPDHPWNKTDLSH